MRNYRPDPSRRLSGRAAPMGEAGSAVLIVEDHGPSRRALAAILRCRGCTVVEAATVAAGLAALEPEPDCAVIDLMLPDGEGESVIRAIRSRGLKTCVVVCTGTGD